MLSKKNVTLTNESVEFTEQGIFIQPVLSDKFRFTGSPDELIQIMIFNKELDIDNAKFYVRILFEREY